MVSKLILCLYILKKVEIWSGVTDPLQTHAQARVYKATQLVSSLKFKLSHAIWGVSLQMVVEFTM